MKTLLNDLENQINCLRILYNTRHDPGKVLQLNCLKNQQNILISQTQQKLAYFSVIVCIDNNNSLKKFLPILNES